MPKLEVTTLDLVIVVAYVVATRAFFGWYATRKAAGGSEAYFLAGRNLGWPIIGLSFYVSNMSGGSFVGLPGSGYASGISVYHYEWFAAPILIAFVFIFLPVFLKARVYTAPEYLETRFGRKARLAFAGFLVVANILVDAPASLYSGAMVASTLFPGIDVWTVVFAASLVAGIYISFGGLTAVVINDAVQAAMILLGGALISILVFLKVPSWQAVLDAAPPQATHLILPADSEVLPWPGLFTGVILVGTYFWCTNQFVIQRALAARTLVDGQRGAILAGFLKLPNLFILVLPGVMATALYPNLERADMVFPVLAFHLLPVGVRGLILAALVAAILSSLEAILNSAATLYTMDFVRVVRPRTSDAHLVRHGRAATVGFMVLAALWTPQVMHFPTLWEYLQSVMSYLTPPVVAVFLFGLLWRRANQAGALAGLAAGIGTGIVGWVLFELMDLWSIHFLYAAGLLFALASVLIVAVSLLTKAPEAARVERSSWSAQLWREGVPVGARSTSSLTNPKALSAMLAVVCLVLLVWWW